IGVVDTVMIAPLGTEPLAAASITSAVTMVFYAGLYGFVSVAGVRMAEAYGAGQGLATATRTAMWVAGIAGTLGAGVMLVLRPYLGALGQPPDVLALLGGYWTAMSLLLIPFTLFYALKGLFDAIDAPWVGVGLAFFAVALNVPANWVLIHGIGGWPGLGLTGAGLASLLSQTAPLVVAWWIWRRAKSTEAARQPAPLSTKEWRTQLREGTTIAVGYIGEGGAYAVARLMMGWFGAAALAADQIVAAVGGVLYMVPLGVSIAVSIRIGQAIGADEARRLATIGKGALTLIVTWMAIVMLGVFVGGGALSAAMSDDVEVVQLATTFFLIVAAMQVFDGIQGTMLGAARGMMDNKVPVAITLASYWIVALPLAYLLAVGLGYGPAAVWVGYGAGLALAATTLTLRFFRKVQDWR
ncbi:MAG: MATE family efflux transporter, partial [Pseudomonadota bacterium]